MFGFKTPPSIDLIDAFLIKQIGHCTTLDFTGPIQYVLIHESIVTKKQYTTKNVTNETNFNFRLLIAQDNRMKEKYTIIPLTQGRLAEIFRVQISFQNAETPLCKIMVK